MPRDRWRQIEDIFHAALERQPDARPAFLEEACRGNEDLRREVEALLRQDAQNGELLSQPIGKVAAEVLTDGAPAVHFSPGSMVGPYRIGERLGAGGMGEVYRAQDTRLQRTVAIKTLKARFTDRFQREARAISALNHPHICTLYDVGSQDGIGYLVMEHVEGEPVKGPLKIQEALRLAIQIASALEAAHEKGILHRDLKPGNILVTRSGVKLLDFGLAKFVATGPRPADVTVTASLTGTGQILGTVAYMSPEQIEGKPVDARSDIFSFGLVLYEILTGRRAFESTSQNGLMAAILKEEPALLTKLDSSIPAALDRTVRKCLAKDPAGRWQTAADLRHELERILESASAAPRRASLPWMITAGVTILLACVAGSFYLHGAPKLTDKDTIVLADFVNKTGDSVFDETLRQGLAVQLDQSPFLSLVSDERIRKTMGLMGQPADAPLTAKVAQEVCVRTSSAAVLEGWIDPVGSQYVLGLRAKNCHTGDILDLEQAQVPRKEEVLNFLSQIARRFRTRVGESLAAVKEHDTPLPDATTPLLEAWKAYSTAFKVANATGPAASLPFFKRAAEIDPQFAMAYAELGISYFSMGEPALAADSVRRAYQLRARASDPERFFITASYDMEVTGNLEKAQQTCEAWARAYPRERDVHGFLSGMIYPVLGDFPKANAEGKKVIEIDPDANFGYNILACSYEEMDRLKEAEDTLDRASTRKLEMPDLLVDRYDIAFLRGDQTGMDRAAALSHGKPDSEDWLTDQEALALAYTGRLQEARKKSRRAAELAQQSGQQERVAAFKAGAAVREGFLGDTSEAKRSATEALKLSTGREVEYGAAFALALAGEGSRSQALAKDLETRFPEDTAVQFSYLPALRGLLALDHGEPRKAIELLQKAVPYELGAPPSAFFGFFGAFYPVYVRGEAYLALHQGGEAAAEFQKILNHRGIVISDPIGALARWRIGKALALSGDQAKARTAYQDFLTLWKDADQDIKILKQAQAEYARLQ